MFQFTYHVPGGGTVPARIISVSPDGFAVIRTPDPFDKGEREFTTLLSQVTIANASNSFLHSSYLGSYYVNCRVLDEDDGSVKILYIDPVLQEPLEIVVKKSDLLPPNDVERLMRFYSAESKDALIEKMEHHILRLQAKLSRHIEMPRPVRIG